MRRGIVSSRKNNEVVRIIGISRPLVVLRMDRGDLPFRYVGKHRRALLKDVLALKSKLDKRQTAMEALAEDTADLIEIARSLNIARSPRRS